MIGLQPPELLNALQFAAVKHQYQRRGGYDRLPYINHLIKVTNALMSRCGITDANVLLAAVLHDIIEDTDVTAADIEARFGAEVSAIVVELTDDMELPYVVRKQRQLDTATQLSKGARVIRLADKASNIEDIFTYPLNWTLDKKEAYLRNSTQIAAIIKGEYPALDQWFEDTAEWATHQLEKQRRLQT
ncbi:MAG: bifunctional (p)ppGpp synthetase/guanosine-3',5'-bis(diphosphate) 3'-pyrophosphohydrolase [Mameliella sp.]|nr:bifunctional (p)ppGpp synthetase/guanosine-3',5'-bis(diphosphate) 3'-pyrophosphohydrolase [Phaeodactylibacter sp.]